MAALLVLAVSLSFAFKNLFEQKRLIEKESQINIWFLAQLEIEHIRLLEALDLYMLGEDGVDKDALMLRFDVFWSRIPVLLEGDQTDALQAVPGFSQKLSELRDLLGEIEPLITNLRQNDRATFNRIRSALIPQSKSLHVLVLDALTYESRATAAERESAERLYYEMLVFSLATYVGIVVLFLALYLEIRRTSLAESEASATRAQLVEAIESISEAFILFDDQDRVVLYNTKYKDFHPYLADVVSAGVPFEQLARSAAERNAVPIARDALEDWVQRTIRSHQNPTTPFESQLNDGRWLKISERKTKHGRIVGVHTDITELKRREVELGRKSALLEATLESINQGICVFDGNLRLVAWNRVFVDMFTVPHGLVEVGRRHIDLVRYGAMRGEYGPGDANVLTRSELRIAEDVAHGKVTHRRAERKRPNGSTITFTYNAMPDGGFVATYTDITERAKAEEERTRLMAQFHAAQEENLRLMMERESAQRRSAETRLIAAIESSSEAIILLDANDEVAAVNTQATRLLPELARSMVSRASFAEVLEEAESRDVFTHRLSEVQEAAWSWIAGLGGTPMVAEEHLSDGRWFRVSRSPGQDGGAVVIWSDVTEMKQREENLRYAKEQAEAANASKTNFLTSMSHELRTPLNAIIGFSEIIAQELFGKIGPHYKEYALDILGSGHHLLDVITDILNFAKSEEGKLHLRVEDVDVAAVIETCQKIMHEQCEKSEIALQVEVSEDTPTIRADVAKLRQILLNLLSNAVKFTPAGGSVALSASRAPDDGLYIRIADTGIGMHAEDIPIALQPFCQLDSTLARKYEGTGLGLPLTQKLLELHGGSLHIDSKLGEGTTVTAHLPAEPMRAGADAPSPNDGTAKGGPDPAENSRLAQAHG